eukprot:2231949-Amphidinium_carterae.1
MMTSIKSSHDMCKSPRIDAPKMDHSTWNVLGRTRTPAGVKLHEFGFLRCLSNEKGFPSTRVVAMTLGLEGGRCAVRLGTALARAPHKDALQ